MTDSNLIERLRLIIKNIENRETVPANALGSAPDVSDRSWLENVKRELSLHERQHQAEPFFMALDHIPMHDEYGSVRLDRASAPAKSYALLGLDRGLECFDLREALFLDLETTGLGQGTGVHAFLIGTAEIVGDELCLRQYFMPDHSYERAMLGALTEALRGKKWIVSFNGKSFDVPLLETRFALNRMRSPFGSIPDFDLLHAARRLWRGVCPCNLTSLESTIMGFERDDDIPGYQIPSIYFDFLKDKDPSPLKAVLRHNRWDVVAMVALLGRMCESVLKPAENLTTSVGAYNLGRLYERAGNLELSAVCYGSAPLHGPAGTVDVRARLNLARLEKRRGNHVRAAELWGEIYLQDPHCIDACVELAKHLEHRKKDFGAALELCKRGLEHLESESAGKSRIWLADLKKRRARLLRKMNHERHRTSVSKPPKTTC